MDTETNKFYDRSNRLYDAALLTRCYTQHALRPFIDSKINHIRQFIKIPFINKGIDFIDLPRTFRDKSVQSAIPNNFKNYEVPIICYKYNKPIKSAIFNFNKLVFDLESKLVTLTPETARTLNIYVYPAEGHVITGNLRIISDSRIRSIIAKGPKYRFPVHIDFQKCREKIAASLNEFCNRWCKQEHVECDALKDWKLNVFKIIDRHISFYSQNTNMLPRKPKISYRCLKSGIEEFHRMYVLVHADKAANNVVVV